MVFKQNMSFNKKKKSLQGLKISDKSKKNKSAKLSNTASGSGLRASGGKETMAPEARLNAAIVEINAAISGLQEEASNRASDSGLGATSAITQTSGEMPDSNPEVHRVVGRSTGTKSEAGTKANPPGVNEIAQFLQTWLDEQQVMFENFAEIMPQLDNTVLDTTDRRRLNGSGVRRYGFIEKVIEVAGEYPQFWPAFVENGDVKQFAGLVKEIDVLRNLSIWFQYSDRVVQDLLLLAGDEAFRWAGLYYTTARDTARRKVPEAIQVFEKLRLFWRKRRRTTGEPTEQEVLRDARALMRGSKDGEVAVKNESDRVVKGERVVIDNTQRKPRGGVKIVDKIREE